MLISSSIVNSYCIDMTPASKDRKLFNSPSVLVHATKENK